MGNALTNKLSAACGQGREQDARHVIATAFWLLLLIGLIIILAGVVLSITLPWASLLNAKSALATQELPLAIALAFVIYGMSIPLGITKSVYSGYQEAYYANYWNIAASVASLLALIVVIQAKCGLPLLVAAVFGARLLVLTASAVFLIGFHRSALTLAPQAARRSDVRSLFHLGLMFVVLQFVGLLVTQTDNLVIVRMLGPKSVAMYGTLWRLFSYVGVLQMWILTPLWPAYGEAYSRGDVNWIRRTLKYSLFGVLALTLLVSVVLIFLAQGIIRLWVGPDLVPRFGLIVAVAVMWIIWGWTQPFVIFLNGISRLRGQMLYGLSTGLLSLALKIVFIPRWSLEGAIGATLLSYILIAAWLLPLDALKGLKSIPAVANHRVLLRNEYSGET
jgi:O-antigen/teichoic acid export membrane protein